MSGTSFSLNRIHHVLGLQLVLFVFFVCLSTTNVRGVGPFQPETHVRITNDLSPETQLSIHCKSKDDDLGTHVLARNGTYEIVFYPNFFGKTLFYCDVQWDSVSVKHFDVYESARDNKICLKCKLYEWSIRNDHPCMLNEKTSQFDICYDWK